MRNPLTPRQRQVLKLLAQGAGTRDIAEQLGCTEVTARNHINAILRRLGVHTRLQAVLEAQRAGLVGDGVS